MVGLILKQLKNLDPERDSFLLEQILRHLRSLAGVQALIGAAIITSLIQLNFVSTSVDVVIAALLWTGVTAFYFVPCYYQACLEQY